MKPSAARSLRSLVATSGSPFKWLRHRFPRDFRHAVASAPLFRAEILSSTALRVALRPPVAKAENRLHGKKRGELRDNRKGHHERHRIHQDREFLRAVQSNRARPRARGNHLQRGVPRGTDS
ncbi:protein of unknown function (plasmid) [Agreia sp. COWG]|nr:protein of unknown function [Agreia sp. COWG]